MSQTYINKFFQRVKQLLLYGGLEKKQYEMISSEIDSANRKSIIIQMCIRDRDHTVILSSHILAEVQEICDDILIISKGKLIAEGSPEELEELTQGKETVELTIQADKDSVSQILSGFSGIDDISWIDVNESSCHIPINTNKDTQEL